MDQTDGRQPPLTFEGLKVLMAGLPVKVNEAVPSGKYILVNADGRMELGRLVQDYDGLTLNEYQRQSMRTAVDPEEDGAWWFQTSGFGLGLTGEAAEVLELAVKLAIKAGNAADLLKKQIHHEHGPDREAMKKELGDVLWYVQGIARRYGLTLDEVAQGNIDKLKSRYPQGWTREDSINRAQEDE